MPSKDMMLKNIHKLYRKDPWIQALYEAAGLPLDDVAEQLDSIYDQYFFDTATWGLRVYEKEMAIKSRIDADIDDRRAVLEARWKSSGKVDIYLLQAVADSWHNEGITVDFIGGHITVTFIGERGFFSDWLALESALEDIKPAHLALILTIIVLLSPAAVYMGATMHQSGVLSVRAPLSDGAESSGTAVLVAGSNSGGTLTVYPIFSDGATSRAAQAAGACLIGGGTLTVYAQKE